jgi:hypothetical protein
MIAIFKIVNASGSNKYHEADENFLIFFKV